MITANVMMVRIILLAVMTMTLFSCTTGNSTGTSGGDEGGDTDSMAVRIAVMPTLDCLPLFVADDCGLFQRESLDVKLVPFTAQMDCDTAIVGGSADGIVTDIVRAERLQRHGTSLRYVAVTDLHWQLLTGKTARIKQLKQLDDKMVAMTRYSATAMITDHLVDSAKLVSERVFRIQVNDVLVRLNMLETGVMDALLLPEPQATVARLLDANAIYDSSRDSLRLGVVAFSEKSVDKPQLKDKMDAFIRAYDVACDSIKERGLSHYRDLIARWCHVRPEIADSVEQQHNMNFPHASPPRQADIDKVKAWLSK